MLYRWVGIGLGVLLSIIVVLFHYFSSSLTTWVLLTMLVHAALGYYIGGCYGKAVVLAHHDSLTGVLVNRRFFELLQREVERARRNHYPVTLMVIDLDDFKKYNDRYGHPAGDKLLARFAQLLRGNVRKQDIVGRWGGEEFVVLLPHTDTSQGMVVGRRIQENVKQELSVITLSIGIATFPDHADTAADLTASADALMYEAKKRKDCMIAGAAQQQTDGAEE